MPHPLHPNFTVVDHPLIAHKLSHMRDINTSSSKFRQLLHEISLLLGYEVLRDLPTELRAVQTPLAETQAPFLVGKKLVMVPLLRAGLGLLDGLLELVPSARVGHIGLYRDPATLGAVEYYLKMPEDISERLAVICDPLLATGNSAIAAVSRLKELGAPAIKLVCLLAAPEGIRALADTHPDVQIFAAALDARIDEHGYILPGLGDAGDRMFGTK